jgi:signal peptidase I
VCNFIDPETNAYFVRTIQSYKHKLETMPFENVDNEFQVLLDTFKKYDRERTIEYFKPMLQKKETFTAEDLGVETEAERTDYIDEAGKYFHTYDRFFKISTYLPGDTVIDKLYTRTNKEAVNTPSGREWVTLLVNVEPGSLDLLTLMRPQTRAGTINIYLSEIINFLKDKGVKEVILFDNSCSVFLDEDGTEYLDRSIRVRRQNVLKGSPGKFGGKTKKRRRQKRSKRRNRLTKYQIKGILSNYLPYLFFTRQSNCKTIALVQNG